MPSPTSPNAAKAATATVTTASSDDIDYSVTLDDALYLEPPDEAPHVEYVAALHGYGRVEPRTKNIVLGKDKVAYEFIGGVCKRIPREVAEDLRHLPGFRMILVPWPKDKETGEPVEPGPLEFAKASGIRPMDVNKLAAYIGAANLDKLIEAMGQAQAQELLASIEQRVRSMPRQRR